MNGKKIVLALLVLAVLTGGCKKDLLEYNTNRNNASVQQLQYDNLAVGSLITQMESFPFPLLQTNGFNYQCHLSLAGDIYSGQQGTSDAYHWNNITNATYALQSEEYDVPFGSAFQNVMTPWYNIRQLSEKAQPHAYALAQILRVYSMDRMTDMYGPLPYINFVPATFNYSYNSQQDIYASFFNELDTAIATLKTFVALTPAAKPLAKYDLIYGGDYTEWLKFANSLKLRLAMRVVYTNVTFGGFTPQQLAEQAVADGVMTDNVDNAVIKVNGVSTINNLYIVCYPFNDTRMGANMESFLKGYNDPRTPLLFTQVALPAGSTPDYHGVRTGIAITGRQYDVCSPMNVTLSTPIQVMTAAEIYFLRAEGRLRGWNMGGGSAQSYYETGITTAFSQPIGGTQGTAGSAVNYINSTGQPAAYIDPLNSDNNVSAGSDMLSKITVKWNDGGTDFETNLERIITQKWIALYPDGQEAWSEFRRTGYPRVFPVVINNSNGAIPTDLQVRRYPFPSSEYQTNATNVAAAATLLGGPDNGGTRLWWDKNPRH